MKELHTKEEEAEGRGGWEQTKDPEEGKGWTEEEQGERSSLIRRDGPTA